MTKIFINYRSYDDGAAAALLDNILSDRFGPDRVFRDSRTIPLGTDYRPDLWGNLARSSAVLVVIGPRWLSVENGRGRKIDDPDDFVRREIALALQIGINVIPILVGETPLPAEADLPDDVKGLTHRQHLRLDPRNDKSDIQPLLEAVGRIIGAGVDRPAPAGTRAAAPTVVSHEPPRQTTTKVRNSGGPVVVGDRNRVENTTHQHSYSIPTGVRVGLIVLIALLTASTGIWTAVKWVVPRFAPTYKTQFLIDATSESAMNGPGSIAKSLRTILGNSGDGDELALRSFGGECGSPDNTTRLVDFDTDNRSDIMSAADTVRGGGDATLLRGIVQAVADFSRRFSLDATQVNRVIVVTQHGTDACDDDTAFVRREIQTRVAAAGLAIEFRLIGFQVPPSQRADLGDLAAGANAPAPMFVDTEAELTAALDWFANIEPVLRGATEIVRVLNAAVERVNTAVRAIEDGRLDVAERELDAATPQASSAEGDFDDLTGRTKTAHARDLHTRAVNLRVRLGRVVTAAAALLDAARSGAPIEAEQAAFRTAATAYNNEVTSMDEALAAVRATSPKADE